MESFIYVYNTKARDYLLSHGMKLLKSDDRNKIYVFLNDEIQTATFDMNEVSCIKSNVLTF